MNLETEVGPVLSYTPYYVYQMMVAAGCTLLKLSKSFFSNHIDMEYTKTLFNRTIWAIRGVSVSSNDLPERLAEVLAQMWRLGVASQQSATSTVDDSLRLKVRCRMSMSLLFDSVWRWREDARTKGRNIECQSNVPTLTLTLILISCSLPQEPDQSRFNSRLICCLVCGPSTHLFIHARYCRWRSKSSTGADATTSKPCTKQWSQSPEWIHGAQLRGLRPAQLAPRRPSRLAIFLFDHGGDGDTDCIGHLPVYRFLGVIYSLAGVMCGTSLLVRLYHTVPNR